MDKLDPIILYRGNEFVKEELEFASKYFKCTKYRMDIKPGQLVIGRYSLIPFYFEHNEDIEYVNARLINNYNEHLYIADLQNYVSDLQELTPQTWNDCSLLPDNIQFVLKGETNSKKSNWLQYMFAASKKEAIDVYGRLCNDSLIGNQKIFIREYIPLFKYFDGINGMPVTKEFRFFVAYNQILCGEYYWQNYIDDLPEKPDVNEVPISLLEEVIRRVNGKCNFYTIDVALTQFGKWIVIELNDGQQAGLSCNSPDKLYCALHKTIFSYV